AVCPGPVRAALPPPHLPECQLLRVRHRPTHPAGGLRRECLVSGPCHPLQSHRLYAPGVSHAGRLLRSRCRTRCRKWPSTSQICAAIHAKMTGAMKTGRCAIAARRTGPPRAHHCRICHRCIRRMDHHCPWINNCVGELNQKYFIQFLFYTALASLYSIGLVLGTWLLPALRGGKRGDRKDMFPTLGRFLITFCPDRKSAGPSSRFYHPTSADCIRHHR
ncbi:unnamed protein product, partial [Staurois parvus]